MRGQQDFEQIAADRDEERGPTVGQAEQHYQNWLAGETR